MMEVSRPDFMGLGLASVSYLKGLGLVLVSTFKSLGLAQDYFIETTRPEGGKNENRVMKKSTRSVVDSNIPRELIMFFM